MDAQQFLAEFGHIANAPGGVVRLRELILHLAMTGKLVQQRSTDESAEILLQRIKVSSLSSVTRNRQNQKKLNRGQSLFREMSLPSGWTLAVLGELGNWGAGSTPSRNNPDFYNGNIPWFKSGELKGELITESEELITELALDRCSLRLNAPGDVLIAMYGANIGQTSIVGVTSTTNQAVCACTPHEGLINQFLLLLLRALKNYFTSLGAGGAQPNISKEKIIATTVGLPPTEEQARIVAKVDELMALCDRLEQQQQQRRKLQNALRQSMLQAVATATSPHELQTTWNRLADNFGQLFSAPEDVNDFVAELKNMAIRGLLAEQSANLPDIEKIKFDCETLRGHYINSGLMRRQKIVSGAESDVIYPEHWAMVPFDDIAIVIGGITKGRDLRNRQTITCPYLAVANVQRGFFKLQDLKTIQIAEEELSKYLVQDGDLLVTEGGDWDKVGRTAIWRGGVKNCLHQNHVFKVRVPSVLLMNEWVELVFNSGVGRDYFAGASKQTTNLASINMTQLRSFPLPVPPLDEQKAILEKLESLIKLCADWHQQLKRKQEIGSLLSNAIVTTFTGITTEPDEEPMKAPSTELIATIRLGETPDIKVQAPLATLLTRHNGEMRAKDLWQSWGLEKGIDAFYAQLKTEVAHGWIQEPELAEMRPLELS